MIPTSDCPPSQPDQAVQPAKEQRSYTTNRDMILFDASSIRSMLERRQIASWLCMRQLATVWMTYLWRIRGNRKIEVLEAQGTRLAEHEVETGNGPAANFLAKL